MSNLGGNTATVHIIANVEVGRNLHLFPQQDLGFVVSDGKRNQAYVQLEYGDILIGKEIGVAGYPLPALTVVNGVLTYGGLIYRVAKGNVTSIYKSDINTDQGVVLREAPVVEVNFLFVPGSSGGPIFDGETGRVLGFVHGYRAEKIRERLETVTLIPNFPSGMGNQYVENVHAIYSLGIKLNYIRQHLEQLGVTL